MMSRSQIRGAPAKVTPLWSDFSHFLASTRPSPANGRRSGRRELGFCPLAFARGGGRPPFGVSWTRPAWRLPAALRPRSGLTIGCRQARLTNPLPGAGAFPIPGQGAGNGGASPLPDADGVSGDAAGRAARPHQFERRKQPPAVVAPQDAARDQLPRQRGGVQTLTAEAARDPQALTQLADLRHAMHGLTD